jgi:hypothetical protein
MIMKWISVKDKLPDENTKVLAMDVSGAIGMIQLIKGEWHEFPEWGYTSCEWGHGGYDSEVREEITHWMLLEINT